MQYTKIVIACKQLLAQLFWLLHVHCIVVTVEGSYFFTIPGPSCTKSVQNDLDKAATCL